jgi:hypothetical protein
MVVRWVTMRRVSVCFVDVCLELCSRTGAPELTGIVQAWYPVKPRLRVIVA